MSPKARDQRRLREDDFYRRPPRGNPAVQFRWPSTVETGAQTARPRGDGYRPPGRDSPEVPSDLGGRGRRGGPAAPAPPFNAVRPRAYAGKQRLLTTAHDDEDDDDDDDDDDDEDPHAFLARLLAELRPQPMPARPPTSFDMIPALRKAREEAKRKGGERHGNDVAKDAEGATAPAQQSVAVKTGAQVAKPLPDATATADDDNADNDADEIQRQTLSPTAKETIAANERAAQAGDEEKLQPVTVRALAANETIERHPPTQLWHSIHRKKAWLYTHEMASWHEDSRGADAPRSKALVVPRRLEADVAPNVAIMFCNGDDGIACSAGLMFNPKEGAPELRHISFEWITHSQLPGFRFKIIRGTGLPSATVWFYANNLRISTGQRNGRRSFVMAHKMGNGIQDELKSMLNFKPRPKGTLAIWETRFSTWSEEDVAAGAVKGVPLIPAKPQVSGISQEDLDRVIATGTMAQTKGDLTVLSTGDWALWGLLTTNDIQIFRQWNENEKGVDVYNFFVRYMDMHLNNVLRYGDWPHYVRQAQKDGRDLYAPDFDLRELEVPRNMITSWRIKWQNGVPVTAMPDTWAAFPFLAVYPNTEAKAFSRRIGAERGGGRVYQHSTPEEGPQKAISIAQKSKKKKSDNGDNEDEDSHAFLARVIAEATRPQLMRPLTSFDKIPAPRENNRKAREVYRASVEINQKRRRSMSKSEHFVQDAEGDTIMAAEKPANERLAEDQPTAKRQKIDEPRVPRQTIVQELPTGQRSYQQGPSVEEENALFADDEQAVGEKPRVVVRLPW
jgi:hypothetical protein